MASKRLQFVVGKGGVGKSVLSAALATAACAPGRRVLAVELGEARGLSRLFGCSDRVGVEPLEAAPGLYLAAVDGEKALAEYLGMIVPIRRLLQTVFATKLYRTFVSAAPGLKELMTIGKIWFENQKTETDGTPTWDAIVVDAGASGHSLQYLQMPQAAARTFKSGLVHRESKRVAEMLADASLTDVHVVAMPEDMPLVEASEIVERLRGEMKLPLGDVFINRCRTPPPPGSEPMLAKITASDDEDHRHFVATVRRTLSWLEVQESGIAELQKRLRVDPKRLPLLRTVEFGRPEIRKLADTIAAAGDRP